MILRRCKVKISVITPFYKGNAYISGLVLNIMKNAENLKKVFPKCSVELLIVNDSPDVEVELPAETGDVECIVVTHKVNSGIHQARVTGLENSGGDYILFLDQDDTVSESFFIEQLPYMKKYDVVIGNAYIEDAEKKCVALYRTKGDFEKVLDVESYIYSHNQITSPGQCMIRKKAIPKEWCQYIMQKNGSDDLFLWMLMFYSNAKFGVNKKCLYTHHYTGVNLSASGAKMSRSSIEFAEYMRKIDYIPNKIIDPFIRSRNFITLFKEKNLCGKICHCLKNADIILIRIKWKLKCRLSSVERG